jgi:NAD(P) transhydrogenase subunit beta
MNEILSFTKNIQFSLGDATLEISYVIASILFIFGLKMLSHPDTARKGNIWAAIGMGLAILATLLFHRMDGEPIGNLGFIITAIVLGTIIGWSSL